MIPSLVVLPPLRVDKSIDPRELTLAQSLVRDLTLTLCRTRHFTVIAPFTARQLAGIPSDLHRVPIPDYQVRTDLVRGQTATARPLLSIEILTADGRSIYRNEIELFSGGLLDLHFGLCSILAEQIAGQIAQEEMLQFRRTGAASAYVHYLFAMEYEERIELRTLLRAQKALKRSIQLAPDYVPALSQLARTMTLEWLERADQDRTLLKEAKHLAERANHYDPADSGSLREIGHAALYLHDLELALASYEAAGVSAPNHADLLADQADVLTHASRSDEAEPRIARALALNPLAPDDYYWIGGAVSFFRGRYEEALTRLQAMKSPGLALRLMAACAAMIDDRLAADAYRLRALERDPTFRLEKWVSLYPQPSKTDTDHYLAALKLAGFE